MKERLRAMTNAKQNATISRIIEEVRMMIDSSTMDECSSAYVRANDALSQLHIGMLKDRAKKEVDEIAKTEVTAKLIEKDLLSKIIGEKENMEIRTMVFQRGITYRELAKRMGITPEWLSRVMAKGLTKSMRERITNAIDSF